MVSTLATPHLENRLFLLHMLKPTFSGVFNLHHHYYMPNSQSPTRSILGLPSDMHTRARQEAIEAQAADIVADACKSHKPSGRKKPTKKPTRKAAASSTGNTRPKEVVSSQSRRSNAQSPVASCPASGLTFHLQGSLYPFRPCYRPVGILLPVSWYFDVRPCVLEHFCNVNKTRGTYRYGLVATRWQVPSLGLYIHLLQRICRS